MAGKVVLITGCSSGGIGHALYARLILLRLVTLMAMNNRCDEFAAHGCNVYATARRIEAMQSFTQPNIERLTLDVIVDASVQEAVKAVIDREGRVDILVNNAGALYVGMSGDNSCSGTGNDWVIEVL